jgi:hypothetical protein
MCKVHQMFFGPKKYQAYTAKVYEVFIGKDIVRNYRGKSKAVLACSNITIFECTYRYHRFGIMIRIDIITGGYTISSGCYCPNAIYFCCNEPIVTCPFCTSISTNGIHICFIWGIFIGNYEIFYVTVRPLCQLILNLCFFCFQCF